MRVLDIMHRDGDRDSTTHAARPLTRLSLANRRGVPGWGPHTAIRAGRRRGDNTEIVAVRKVHF